MVRWPEKNHCPWVYTGGQYTEHLLWRWAGRLESNVGWGQMCPLPSGRIWVGGRDRFRGEGHPTGLGAGMEGGREPRLAIQKVASWLQ